MCCIVSSESNLKLCISFIFIGIGFSLKYSLSLNVIPIVEDNECFSQFKHLPIMFINNWQDVTVPMLKDKIPQYIGKKFDLSVLDINYWRKII